MKITLKKVKPVSFSTLNKGSTFRFVDATAYSVCMKLSMECGRGRYVSLATGEVWYTPDVRKGADDLQVIPVNVEAVATDIA